MIRAAANVQNGSFFGGLSGPIASPNLAARRWWICSAVKAGMGSDGLRDVVAGAGLAGRARLLLLRLALHDLLDAEEALGERLGARRATRHVDVDRHHLVDALADRIAELEEAAAVGARAHREDVLRLGHLVV